MSGRSVVLPAAEGARLAEVAAGLGLHVDAPGGHQDGRLRPGVVVDGGQVGVCVLGHADDGLVEVRVVAGAAGLVAVAPDRYLAGVRRVVDAADDPLAAVADVLLAVALSWEDVLEDLVDLAQDLGGSLRGLRSAEPRQRIMRLRARLFAIRHRLTVQARMLRPGEDLADALPQSARPSLTRARLASEAGSSTAEQTYELLGDVLQLQATTISERLTLASVVFLPLTVVTGLFGMNFGWLSAEITSAASFWLLGVAFPVLVVAGILFGIRRYDAVDDAGGGRTEADS